MMHRTLALFGLILIGACDPHPESPPCRADDPQPDFQANAGCVVLAGDHVLVLTHRDSGKLGIPGGAREGNESAQCTAHRETFEETGLDVRVGRMLGRMRYGFTLYRCHTDQPLDPAEKPPLPWYARLEMTDANWIHPDEIPRDRWRYNEQSELFLHLVEKGLDRPQP